MVPHAAPLHPVPLTLQITAVFGVPVTVAANCCVDPTASVALFGLTYTTTGPAEFVALGEILLAFVKPAHPERVKNPNRATTRRTAYRGIRGE